jgi:tRNA 2-selenouridine synthase SelU
MNLNEILFLDAKNSCMKKIIANLKLRNVQTSRSQQYVIQPGGKKLERLT